MQEMLNQRGCHLVAIGPRQLGNWANVDLFGMVVFIVRN